MSSDWNPSSYLRFERDRTLPCIDLVRRVETTPRTVLDVGCGPGNSAQAALGRWPNAAITGIDSSPAMIEAARVALPEHQWQVLDARQAGGRYDLVLSNAALQWIPDHETLLPALLALVAPGGALAVQIPLYNAMPASRMVDAVYGELVGRHRGVDDHFFSRGAAFYEDVLGPLASGFELWETWYHHRMTHQAIVDMLRSTGLRPYLDDLGETTPEDFEEAVRAGMRLVYPARSHGTVLFPFRRLFFVAYR